MDAHKEKKRWRCLCQFILRSSYTPFRKTYCRKKRAMFQHFIIFLSSAVVQCPLAIWNVQVVSSHRHSGGSLTHRSAPSRIFFFFILLSFVKFFFFLQANREIGGNYFHGHLIVYVGIDDSSQGKLLPLILLPSQWKFHLKRCWSEKTCRCTHKKRGEKETTFINLAEEMALCLLSISSSSFCRMNFIAPFATR